MEQLNGQDMGSLDTEKWEVWIQKCTSLHGSYGLYWKVEWREKWMDD